MSVSSSPPVTDAEHFAVIHKEFRRPIEGYIANRLPRRDHHLAEDIASEVFVSLWKSYYAQGNTVNEKPWGCLPRSPRGECAITSDWHEIRASGPLVQIRGSSTTSH